MSREFTFALGTVRNEPRIDRFKRGGLVTAILGNGVRYTLPHARFDLRPRAASSSYLWAAGLRMATRIIYRKGREQ
jgi:hypothetical protein